jgi:hypothetical protein
MKSNCHIKSCKKTTCVVDCILISFTSKMASSKKPADNERVNVVKEKCKQYTKMILVMISRNNLRRISFASLLV